MADKKSFQSITLYKDMAPQVLELTREEAGEIYQAIFRFSCYGEDTDFSHRDRFVRSLWETTKLKLKAGENHAAYISEVRAEAGRKGGNAKAGNCKELIAKASNCATYTDTVTGTNTDTISSTVTTTESEQRTAAILVDRLAASAAAEAEPPAGDLFSVNKLISIVNKNKVDLTQEGINEFYNQMQMDNWTLYNKPVCKNTIVRVLREYSKRHPEYNEDFGEDEKSTELKEAKAEINIEEERRQKRESEDREVERLINDPDAMKKWLEENGYSQGEY